MKRLATLSFMVLIGLALITGCASTEKITPTTPIQELKAPDWVMKGSGAFGGEQGKVFYGVASAFGIKNPSLLRSAADNRAISEISKTFQVYTASLQKDYMASTMAGDPNVTSEEQHVEQALKTVTTMTLSGVQIVDHWQNPATGELFSLARLELDAFKDNLDKVKNLDKKVKEYIKENAEKMHDELSKEEEKRK
ncbi:MAG: LPP20 family lipoprotein [Nitrospirae bacterium]|nr:LPP20 family lipoprotein [Nitrospirota bacterium]